MTRYSTYGQNRSNTVNAIANREDFKTGGALRGEDQGYRYVVYSYAEPIAIFEDGKWTVTTVKFSVTTGRHQTLVRQATGFAYGEGTPERLPRR